jgi:hypothetical protein
MIDDDEFDYAAGERLANGGWGLFRGQKNHQDDSRVAASGPFAPGPDGSRRTRVVGYAPDARRRYERGRQIILAGIATVRCAKSQIAITNI